LQPDCKLTRQTALDKPTLNYYCKVHASIHQINPKEPLTILGDLIRVDFKKRAQAELKKNYFDKNNEDDTEAVTNVKYC
jgi:hypothetical protein